MRQTKIFKRSPWKTLTGISLLVLEIIVIGGFSIACYHVNFHEAKEIYAFCLLIAIGFIPPLAARGYLNYVVLTETAFILRNATFSFVQTEYPFEDIYMFTFYHSRRHKSVYLRIIRKEEDPEKRYPPIFIECVPPRDYDEILQTLRAHGVFMHDHYMEDDFDNPYSRDWQ